jgi:hypothetical protein
MLSTAITALLVCIMLSIIISYAVSAMRAHKRKPSLISSQATTAELRLDAILPTQTLQFRTPQLIAPQILDEPALPHTWYRRRRTFVSGALLMMVVLTLFVQSGLADGAFKTIQQGLSAFNLSQHQAGFDISTELPPIPFSAAQRVVRVDSAARDQYYTDYQWQVWSYSSCSGIAMEMVINAYGHNYIAADFLQKEADLGLWNVAEGLTGGEQGIATTAAYFGFKALPNPPRTLADLMYTVNKGFPVIVGNPGHIMVVRAADKNYIYVDDSSPANRDAMTYSDFMAWWDGFSVVLVPA